MAPGDGGGDRVPKSLRPATAPAVPQPAGPPRLERWVDFANYAGFVRSDQIACLREQGVAGVIVGVWPRRADIALRQMQAVREAGLRLMVYGEPTSTTGLAFAEVIRLATPYGPERYWVDIEPAPEFGYEPDLAGVVAALGSCVTAGVPGGVYTGAWVVERYAWLRQLLRERPELPLWLALYDGVASLDGHPHQVIGKQYRGSHTVCGISVDANVFRA